LLRNHVEKQKSVPQPSGKRGLCTANIAHHEVIKTTVNGIYPNDSARRPAQLLVTSLALRDGKELLSSQGALFPNHYIRNAEINHECRYSWEAAALLASSQVTYDLACETQLVPALTKQI
jgi:hypothetical protein